MFRIVRVPLLQQKIGKSRFLVFLCAFTKYAGSTVPQDSCGVVDSLRMLLMQENFVKLYSDVHVLATLLTKSF